MKALLTVSLLLLSVICFGQGKYPIQTLYKGDSVVILSIKQSVDINRAIDTQKRIIREQSKKLTLETTKVDSLNKVIENLSLKLENVQYQLDTTQKWADELNLTIWEMAAGPSLLYTMPPYNEILFLNLKNYNMFSIDNGDQIQLTKMTTKEFKQFQELDKKYNQTYYPTIDYFKMLKFKDFEKETQLYKHKIWKNKILLQE
jgi:hypothetical protein